MEASLFKVKKDWRSVLFRAWSSWAFWGILFASIFTAISTALPIAFEFGLVATIYYPYIVGAAAMLGLGLRLLVQVGITDE